MGLAERIAESHVHGKQVTDYEAPVGQDVGPARYLRPAQRQVLVPRLESGRTAQ
jgi:hypothetical protein